MIASKSLAHNFMRFISVCFVVFMLIEGTKLLNLTHQQVELDQNVDYCSFNTLSILFAVSLAAMINSEHLINIGVAWQVSRC